MIQMVREGTETGNLPNSSDFMQEFEVSRRTVARDLDFLRDEERAPLAYDDARHGFRLTDETYTLPPVKISRKEAFSFGLARKLTSYSSDARTTSCVCPWILGRNRPVTEFENRRCSSKHTGAITAQPH